MQSKRLYRHKIKTAIIKWPFFKVVYFKVYFFLPPKTNLAINPNPPPLKSVLSIIQNVGRQSAPMAIGAPLKRYSRPASPLIPNQKSLPNNREGPAPKYQ